MFQWIEVQNINYCFRNATLKTWNVTFQTWNVSGICCSKDKMFQKREVLKNEMFQKLNVENMKYLYFRTLKIWNVSETWRFNFQKVKCTLFEHLSTWPLFVVPSHKWRGFFSLLFFFNILSQYSVYPVWN